MAPLVEFRVGDGGVEAPGVGSDSESRNGYEPPGFHPRRRWRRRYRHNRYLRDMLTGPQRATLAGLILLWATCTLWSVSWWLEPQHWDSLTGLVLNSVLLGIELVLMPVYLYVWLWRMKRPDPTQEVPQLRTAMIVTKAPSEPWVVVRRTLEAMLEQDFPYTYDVWLADERVEPDTRAWCEEHGVRISSREGVPDYHQASWPRRTRCKEGNLAFFYDIWGYRLYDVVAQLDADHVPAPGYLRHMVTPFVDDDVGYVAAPSICDNNADHSWSARGRLFVEAVLHGPMQAGHTGGFAPSCIGSHYAVRTAALQEIGGIGPELAEDFTTTLMMSSHGWQGVFAIDAEAHGDGPECLEDCLTQEFQWSRSMMNVVLGVNGSYWTGLSTRAKLRLGFCQVWYPLFAVLMLLSILLPLAAVFTQTPLMQVGLGDFYKHIAPGMLVLVATVLWLRALDWLRPRSARAVSWEVVLFQLIRWPWVLLGCAHSIVGRIAGRQFGFKVTPKGRSGILPLPTRVVAPYLFIAVVSALPTLLSVDAGAAGGYLKLALLNAGLYLFAAAAIVVLHVHEHPSGTRRVVLRSIAPKAVATAACSMFLLVGLGLQGFGGQGAQPALASPIVSAPLAAGVPQLGVSTQSLAKNPTMPWRPGDLAEVNAFEQMSQAHVGIVQWFADWRHSSPDVAQLRAVAARGSTPQITWEPWDSLASTVQTRYTLASIIGGSHDDYIRSWARTLSSYGGPVQLRFAQEMNGYVYPWVEGLNSNRPGEFVRAWRHVHDIFTAEGATNVRWVWTPVTGRLKRAQYPGDNYVDIVGLSGFNGGTELDWSGWRTFADAFDGPIQELRHIAPDKPVQISEVATASQGGNKPLWIKEMFDYVIAHPFIKEVLWFDLPKQVDWRVATSPSAERAFGEGAARMQGRAIPIPVPAPQLTVRAPQ
ncbi:MAG TPA: glycosyltransferase [Solirubrobacteraceae bacterium]|nr:glycosyltransferase [Solirubrobacteraceae bacterium]